MSRGQRVPERLRAFWERAIPETATVMYLSDAHRYIEKAFAPENADALPPGFKPRQLVTLRTLQRRAESGDLDAQGGPGTPLRTYRITRDNLIHFLCRFDGLWVERPERAPSRRLMVRRRPGKGETAAPAPLAESESPVALPPSPPPPKPRNHSPRGGTETRRPLAVQPSLFDE